MKKITAFALSICMLLSFTSCKKEEAKEPPVPGSMEIQSICELSTLDCYYHNVAKYYEDIPGIISYFDKYKRFWMEYSGNIKVGIDASLLKVERDGRDIVITMPEAKVLDCNVDESTLVPESFIDDKKAVAHTVEDEQRAFKEAKQKMIADVEADKKLLSQARDRAQALIREYIRGISAASKESYNIKWVLKNSDGDDTVVKETVGEAVKEDSQN